MGVFAHGHQSFYFTPIGDMDGAAARTFVGRDVVVMDAEVYERYEILRQAYEEKLLAR